MSIRGLQIVDDFLTSQEEMHFLGLLNVFTWDTSISRRVIHFGYRYNYHGLNKEQEVYPVPEWLTLLFLKCKTSLNLPIDDESKLTAIVNEYFPGQGIAPHIDDPKIFGDSIICIVLNSGCNVQFSTQRSNDSFYIKNKAMYCMTQDARYMYRHSIDKKTYDVVDGMKVERKRRVSITFRYQLFK